MTAAAAPPRPRALDDLRPALGHGIGLRTRHFADWLAAPPRLGFVEAVTENHLAAGGRPLEVLERVRRDVPVALHGVSLSIGSVDPLSPAYLARLAALVRRLEPAIVSDHLCWGSHGGRYVHDLWPLPQTEEAVEHVAARVRAVQDALGRRILLENVSSYARFAADELTEWEFVAEVARRADCGILLDVNNVVVSARNHGFDPVEYVAGLPGERIGQLHLAGHQDRGTHLFDSHDGAVPDPVWALYREVVRRFGPVPALVEWDDRIPPLDEVLAESRRAAAIEGEVLAEVQAGVAAEARTAEPGPGVRGRAA